MIRAIFGSAEEIADIALIVKPHPSDNLREIKTLAKPFKHTSVINSNMPISKLIAACDVFVTFFSQTGIEALMAGKPVVNVRFPGSTGDSHYIESGATCLAQTEEEIGTLFHRLTGEDRKSEMAQRENARMQLLSEWTYLPDGRSSQRVRNLINNLHQEMNQQSRG
jgi:CDP-glycerol glycerophosphotransferase (TagB/SpsB family)